MGSLNKCYYKIIHKRNLTTTMCLLQDFLHSTFFLSFGSYFWLGGLVGGLVGWLFALGLIRPSAVLF